MKFTVTGLFLPLKTYKNIFLRITSYRLVTLQFLSPGRSSTNLYKALKTPKPRFTTIDIYNMINEDEVRERIKKQAAERAALLQRQM